MDSLRFSAKKSGRISLARLWLKESRRLLKHTRQPTKARDEKANLTLE